MKTISIVIIIICLLSCNKKHIAKDCSGYESDYFNKKNNYEHLYSIYSMYPTNSNKSKADKAKEEMDKSKKLLDECNKN